MLSDQIQKRKKEHNEKNIFFFSFFLTFVVVDCLMTSYLHDDCCVEYDIICSKQEHFLKGKRFPLNITVYFCNVH